MQSDLENELEGYLNGVFDGMENGIKSALKAGMEKAFEGRNISGKIGEYFSEEMQKMLSNTIEGVIFGTGGSGESGGMGRYADAMRGFMPGGKRDGGKVGGLLGRLLGSELSFFGGGLGGVVGGLGALASLGGLFGGGQRPATSGVEEIFGSGPRVYGGGLDVLYGSDVFERASFSSRNAGNELLSRFAGPRMGREITVHIRPSREFDAISEQKWVATSRLNEMAGIPRRTNFNHG